MRSPITLTIFLLTITLGTGHVTHGFHEARLQREANRIEAAHTELQRQCRLAFIEGESRTRCIENGGVRAAQVLTGLVD